MAKYVCDFAEVIAAGEKLCSAANNIKTAECVFTFRCFYMLEKENCFTALP